MQLLPASAACDLDYWKARLANPHLLLGAVAVALHRLPLPAVPVGADRHGGFMDMAGPVFAEALACAPTSVRGLATTPVRGPGPPPQHPGHTTAQRHASTFARRPGHSAAPRQRRRGGVPAWVWSRAGIHGKPRRISPCAVAVISLTVPSLRISMSCCLEFGQDTTLGRSGDRATGLQGACQKPPRPGHRPGGTVHGGT
ncbi:DUF6302 family protein [Streptomyces chromofuscus]|uniref:DUF6302 family protein n=1 Tax=Streptomyces chromofuscus TaxID=42881 RepID=UPI001D13A700